MNSSRALGILLLVATAHAGDGRKFESLKAAKEAVNKARESALAALAEKGLPIPERLLAADGHRRAALRAWSDKRFDQAHVSYEAAWTTYEQHDALFKVAREEHTHLLGFREKKPPELRLGFKQRKAIHRAHEWLARHQDASGRWDCAGFMELDPDDDRCDGGGDKEFDTGVTALAVLAFLEAGFTDRDNHYAVEVRRGLQWLRAQEDQDGAFGSREPPQFIYNHAITMLAIAKALALTKDDRYRAPVERGVAFMLKARQPGKGWRYDPEESDTSATTWCFRALATAKVAGIDVDLADVAKGAQTWLDSVTRADGLVTYTPWAELARPEGKGPFLEDRSRAMTAAGTVLRMALQPKDHDRAQVLRSLDRCLDRPPKWSPDGSIDMYYWYYGSLAFQADKKRARKWQKQLHKAVLSNQQTKGARAGSWNPVGVWRTEGGRVYATAILALALVHAG